MTDEKKTGLIDKNGTEILSGDFVSLDGNLTTDDSLGVLPNGWFFDSDNIYEVYFDERVKDWSLKLGVEPDTAYNCKYMNHAVGLLHDGDIVICKPPKKKEGKDD